MSSSLLDDKDRTTTITTTEPTVHVLSTTITSTNATAVAETTTITLSTAVHVYEQPTPTKHTTLLAADATTNAAESATTLLILHGCGGRKEEWRDTPTCLAPYLAVVSSNAARRVVVFDWFGHGASDDLPGMDYSVNVFLQQLEAVVDAYCPDKFHLYAFSMGNYLALHYLVRQQQQQCRIQRLVLHSPWNAELSAFMGPTVAQMVRRVLSRVPLGRAALERLRRAAFPHVHTADIFENILVNLGRGMAAWQTLLRDVATILASQQQQQQQQVLILCGQKERPFGKIAKEIHETFTASRVAVEMHTHPTASHMSWHDEANVGAVFRQWILDFLSGKSDA